MGPSSDVSDFDRGWDSTDSVVCNTFILGFVVIGAPIGGMLLDCSGWSVAVVAASFSLFGGNVLLLCAQIVTGHLIVLGGVHHASASHWLHFLGLSLTSLGARRAASTLVT